MMGGHEDEGLTEPTPLLRNNSAASLLAESRHENPFGQCFANDGEGLSAQCAMLHNTLSILDRGPMEADG